MTGLFITFEGTEGSGKSTQIQRLGERLRGTGRSVRTLREPGAHNAAMCAETELLLMNASRAQLVRELIRPALAAGGIVLCDRFYDSTIAYQAYGRQLDLEMVKAMIDFAVGETRPDLTLLMVVSEAVSVQRRKARQSTLPFLRDRIEEADLEFFRRVAQGYQAVATAEPGRVRVIDGARSIESIAAEIWNAVQLLLARSSP